MSRSRNSNQLAVPEEEQPEAPPSRCVRFLYFLWKFCTCVFSHVLLVSLVVSYCILGAFTFEHLEADNERKVCQLGRYQNRYASKYLLVLCAFNLRIVCTNVCVCMFSTCMKNTH